MGIKSHHTNRRKANGAGRMPGDMVGREDKRESREGLEKQRAAYPIDADETHERAPRATDPDDVETRQRIGADLDGFLFPGHHRVSGGWDGPDD